MLGPLSPMSPTGIFHTPPLGFWPLIPWAVNTQKQGLFLKVSYQPQEGLQGVPAEPPPCGASTLRHIPASTDFALLFHCWTTKYHIFGGTFMTPMNYLSVTGSSAQRLWRLKLGIDRGYHLIWSPGFSSKLDSFWHNSVLWNCSTEISIFLLAIGWRYACLLRLASGLSHVALAHHGGFLL
jgi:hypothetical protein